MISTEHKGQRLRIPGECDKSARPPLSTVAQPPSRLLCVSHGILGRL